MTGLEKEVNHWKTRFEVAKAFIDLSRKAEQKQERTRKKKKRRRSADGVYKSGDADVLASMDDGRDIGDPDQELGAMDEQV